MNETATPPLPASRSGFWSLIVTQFQGAFNDLALKTLVVFLIMGMDLPPEKRDLLIALIGAIFAIPFILFSMAGGFLADRCSKRSVVIAIKIFEIAVMLFSIMAFSRQAMPLAFLAVFLMGTHSAFFSPSKYGLLPEILPEKHLSWGNGILELFTFVAIILGTMEGGLLSTALPGRQAWSGVILLMLSVAGLLTSLGIPRVPAADPARKFRMNALADLVAQVRQIRKNRVLWLATVGNTYFFFLAALLQFVIVIHGKDVLRLDDAQNGYLLAVVAIGIGVGSFAAGYLSNGKIEYGLIPLGSLGMTVFAGILAIPGLSVGAFATHLALLGFFSGFFIVPIAALLQHLPDRDQKGTVLAATSLLSFVGVFLASGVYYLLTVVLHLGTGGIFLGCAVATLAGTIYVVTLLPDALLRLLLWMLTHSIYRIRVEGRDNLPEKGGALLVANHLSMVDPLLVMASTDRFVRFLMYKTGYEFPLLKPFVHTLRVIPISPQQSPREMITSLREAGDSIRRGEVVCIFAEGQITRTGQMLPFRRGFERIMNDVNAPIIPVSLDRVWGSVFSFEKGRLLWKQPRRIPYPVTVSYGKPMPPGSPPHEVRQAVQELQSDSWRHRRRQMRPLPRAFIKTARRHPFRFAMADGHAPRVTFGAALTRATLLARRLKAEWRGQRMVGILLPPSVPGALVNLAAQMAGKIPVNLNYTLPEDALASCIRQCDIRSVVTSRTFLERVKITPPGKLIYLEDLASGVGIGEKLAAFLLAWGLPADALETCLGRTAPITLDDTATVIFSSGSTGEPKGIVLSHYNIVSNIEQVNQVFAFQPRDRILGILPCFHSFGFTTGLFLPATLGVGIAYHPNPLDARGIGALVNRYRVTFLMATPTFLQMYIRGCPAEDFGSLRLVVAGAEKLPERLAAAFEDKFGIRPMEGYGCTECSPVVAVNVPDFRGPGFRQVGAKRGTVGHPLPGISVRLADPDTMQPVPPGQAGMLLVRGPNVMTGYLGLPDRTAAVLRDGWYVTGDIAALDEDGFLTITDRLSRFSKIGGEMVPHVRVEEKLHELAGIAGEGFAVTGVPDEKKGERLVVLHTLSDEKFQECLGKLPQAGLPNLWIPRASQFFRVDELPHLGTGKLDLRRIRELAVSLSTAP
ncbi:MAG: acyl-[ACP]--phospholipid O-acyltransferase [Planctomycetota bacterium]